MMNATSLSAIWHGERLVEGQRCMTNHTIAISLTGCFNRIVRNREGEEAQRTLKTYYLKPIEENNKQTNKQTRVSNVRSICFLCMEGGVISRTQFNNMGNYSYLKKNCITSEVFLKTSLKTKQCLVIAPPSGLFVWHLGIVHTVIKELWKTHVQCFSATFGHREPTNPKTLKEG